MSCVRLVQICLTFDILSFEPYSFSSATALAQMPLTTVDGSSVVSESRKVSITSRDGGVCILCGMDPVDVAHIVARKSGDQGRVSETI